VQHGGGKGANAAVAAARVGASVMLVGAVGDDDTGRGALDELRAEGVDVGGVAVLDGVATGVALIVVDAAGENQIAVGAGANDHLEAAHVRATLRGIDDLAVVLVSTEVPAAAVAAAVGTAAELRVGCVLNPAPVVHAVLGLLDLGPLLTPNEGELADLVRRGRGGGDTTPDSTTEAGAAALHAATGAPVVVTLGGDGMLLVDSGGAGRLRAHPTTVRDTTGAGDTANGVLVARLAAGDDLGDAVVAANVAAALSVAVTGARAGMPTAEALEAALGAGDP
jgi:ribokinase